LSVRLPSSVRDWLLVASAQDTSALWAFERLSAHGRPCQVLLTEALQSSDVRWVHHVTSAGARVTVTLADGRRIDSADIAAVLNRTFLAPFTVMAQSQWPDSAYARSEQSAFALSWLQALAPVVLNPPVARGLGGAWRSATEWFGLAQRAGLPCAPLTADSHEPDTLMHLPMRPNDGVVIGTRTFGVADLPGLREAAVTLARTADTPLLGLWFSQEGPPRLETATPHPDLSLGGEAAVHALAELLAA
jgi:hypothetical protein